MKRRLILAAGIAAVVGFPAGLAFSADDDNAGGDKPRPAKPAEVHAAPFLCAAGGHGAVLREPAPGLPAKVREQLRRKRNGILEAPVFVAPSIPALKACGAVAVVAGKLTAVDAAKNTIEVAVLAALPDKKSLGDPGTVTIKLDDETDVVIEGTRGLSGLKAGDGVAIALNTDEPGDDLEKALEQPARTVLGFTATDDATLLKAAAHRTLMKGGY